MLMAETRTDTMPAISPASDTHSLLATLRSIVGARHVVTGDRQTRRYRTGFRQGSGATLAVVRPASLVEQWRVLKACVAADMIIICQAANTGLTGGSTPDGDGYDRPIVIINLMRIKGVHLIGGGEQVISLPGTTLDELERRLQKIGREPHSVLGSTCMGATVTGGVCNNSGGALVRRGPAFTQLALFAQIAADGTLQLVNHLGVRLDEDPERALAKLDAGALPAADIADSGNHWASDREYHTHVRDVDAATPARFNADPRRHFEASGSAGKLAVFALRLDTFAADQDVRVFYIGTNDPAELQSIRRDILRDFEHLPIAGEYMHRDAYRLSEAYGRDLFLFIRHFGASNVPRALAAKSWFDGITDAIGLGSAVSDRLLQLLKLLPLRALPRRMQEFRDRFEHHLMIKVTGDGAAEARIYLSQRFPSAAGDYFECDKQEGEAAFLNRFVTGGAVSRYRALNEPKLAGTVSLDVALPRNTDEWLETLPAELEAKLERRIYAGHFLCHVMHQEYFVKKGEDCAEFEREVCALLDARGAEYPAEHNVGHHYVAKPALREFYRALDPTNTFNPGIGRTSRRRHWHD